ncbi:hypothetical protein MEO40_25895 [Dolichospermum sp. ST_sed1]|nr:hypothetical protein [Dolichospermum sp. ST_sed1]MDD1428717.1 hypothetical protein [Dolichospermum sp. ST_sed9]MDD1433491.1 hypothetical protein [Dolichospermum sp. ST_sed6]MDD1443893.1 hypothetical protein [Dolichospermum sp. ST_sed3]MDD1448537.1 hypothetical protein [Dolichospermum sp. ST_sed8]MDD1458231.1 hypothetical protein [Dolichospermum sp. ST_sed7]MDD1461496.1 hypothetical protein [Dolichospermum sp. ST_sed2]MDD1466305.1 hypothetical protein [Dolichospermum sp. ST_sed5]MDD147210
MASYDKALAIKPDLYEA